MSSGLMSCVRDNSPPLEYEDTRMANKSTVGGPQSLPVGPRENRGVESLSDKPTVKSSTTMTASITGGNSDGGVATPNAEQQKRRRFHMLRNLGRIFRRRTITSITDAPAAAAAAAQAHTRTLPVQRVGAQPISSNSEKNLRSAALNSMPSMPSASSPSSPLTHQQLQEAYNTQSLPKSKTYTDSTQLQRDVLLLGKSSSSNISRTQPLRHQIHQTLQHDSNGETSTDYDITIDEQKNTNAEMYAATATTNSSSTAYHHQIQQRMNQSIGVAVLPPIVGGHRSRNFITERQKLRSVESSHDLDSSDNHSAEHNNSGNSGARRLDARNGLHNGSSNSDEITDSQRSLSEGRLVDSDFTREGLSQSHDSVFSESATASSLSIVLRAELADVLRKRRPRPDGSDEDLGLPRSPGSPQRRAEQLGHNTRPTNNSAANNTNQSEVSSVSLLSMGSNECDDFQATSTANNSMIEQHQSTTTTTRYVRSATFSPMPTEIFRHPTMSASFNEGTKDEVDLLGKNCQRLSHSAAKHKMAIRPVKKNVPTRQHRRTLETSIPEANEHGNANNINARNSLDTLNADVKSKSKSLPPCVNAELMEQQHGTANETETASSSIKKSIKSSTVNTASSNTETSKSTMFKSETCESTTKISSSSGTMKMFGLRAANKSTKIKEHENEKEELTTVDSTESGFLRRLMQRNSKRNYDKANAGDDPEKPVVSEPKKIPISSSCFEMTSCNLQLTTENSNLDKVKSAMSYEQSVEATRKVIKREIMNEGKCGLSAILNNFTITTPPHTASTSSMQPTTSTAAASKPKSGPAARQRYMPQNIADNKVAIPPPSQQESFESTTLIRNITTKKTPTKSPHRVTDASTLSTPHHFEKKPKIVGLSAFQQKISRSNDSVVRISASNNSIDDQLLLTADAYAKQRKSVEKSRSFRTYNEEQREFTAGVCSTTRNNMPSLPDLTLNLRVPNYTQQFILQEKGHSSTSSSSSSSSSAPSPPEPPQEKCVSLGFEINDNTLLKPHIPRAAESAHNIYTSSGTTTGKRNLIVTTNGSGNIMSNLSPSSNYQANITEIEQNIDVIVKSPFINVNRKSANLEQVDIKYEEPVETPQLPQVEVFESKTAVNDKKRPKSLVLLQKTKSEEQLSVTTTKVALRSRLKSNDDDQLKNETTSKETERKSAPVSTNSNNSLKNLQRSSTECNEPVTPQIEQPLNSDVPEFMKIQLNHVDQARLMVKSNVVLAKNVKEPIVAQPNPTTVEKPAKTDSDLSVIISERPTAPETQQKLIKTSEKRLTELPPKSPTKKALNTPTATPATTPNTSPTTEQFVEPENTPTLVSHKLSIQERRRLFMAEPTEKSNAVKKIEEIRSERKKSMSEEVYRKLSTCGRLNENSKTDKEEKKSSEELEKKVETPTTPTKALNLNSANAINNSSPINSNTNSPINEPNVILRKKSFASNAIISNNNNNKPHKDDSTPELMKVFARRSLKVKDEDIAALTEKINEKKTNGTSMPQQNVDSDKENQSSSEEKLYKLSVDLEQMSSVSKITNNKLQTTTSNRNSVADFRHTIVTPKNGNVYVNNNNNNTNNNVNNTNASISNNKSQLPPIKIINGQRTATTERNGGLKLETKHTKTITETNNNMKIVTSPTINIKRTYERQSLNIKSLEPASPSVEVTSKPIERSATVGEFKGIHQRRAEWEQRAKEALK